MKKELREAELNAPDRELSIDEQIDSLCDDEEENA